MSEVSFPKVLWEREPGGAGAMDSCYKLYTWINHTVLMLLFQIFWKVSQISDYLSGKSSEPQGEMVLTLSPLTKDSKYRRHIRSMSDVQSSSPAPAPAPHRVASRARRGSSLALSYDSDTRARRVRAHHRPRRHEPDSSDSSDYYATPHKIRSLGNNIIKHTDSMRIL